MTLAYINLVIPAIITRFIAYSFIGLLIVGYAYSFIRIHKKATLTFLDDGFKVVGRNLNLVLNIHEMNKIVFIDKSRDFFGISIERFVVRFKRPTKSIRMSLKNYDQWEDFVNEFVKFKNIKYEFSNFEFDSSFEGEI